MTDTSSRNLKHPVWSVYDQLRTSRLNVLYYTAKLEFSERLQLLMQLILAATVPSSAIAGFELWDFGLGKYAWEILVSLSSLIAFIQPFIGLQKKIKKLDELTVGYKILYFDLIDIKQKIEEEQKYTSSHQRLFKAARNRRKKLEIKETGLWQNNKLRNECQDKVKSELPAKYFYVPEEV